MSITVVKRNGEREPYDANKINLAIEHASAGLDENITWVTPEGGGGPNYPNM